MRSPKRERLRKPCLSLQMLVHLMLSLVRTLPSPPDHNLHRLVADNTPALLNYDINYRICTIILLRLFDVVFFHSFFNLYHISSTTHNTNCTYCSLLFYQQYAAMLPFFVHNVPNNASLLHFRKILEALFYRLFILVAGIQLMKLLTSLKWILLGSALFICHQYDLIFVLFLGRVMFYCDIQYFWLKIQCVTYLHA